MSFSALRLFATRAACSGLLSRASRRVVSSDGRHYARIESSRHFAPTPYFMKSQSVFGPRNLPRPPVQTNADQQRAYNTYNTLTLDYDKPPRPEESDSDINSLVNRIKKLTLENDQLIKKLEINEEAIKELLEKAKNVMKPQPLGTQPKPS